MDAQGRRGGTAAALVSVTLLLAGCAGASTAPAQQTPIPLDSAWRPGLLVSGHGPQGLGPSLTASPSDTTLDDAVQQQLATVGLAASDLGGGLTVRLATDGTSLAVPSLNYCRATYTSEAAREAHRKVELLTAGGARTGVTSDAVLYRTPVDAVTALDELRAAQASCPAHRRVVVSGHVLRLAQRGSADVPTAGLVAPADRVLVSTEVEDRSISSTYRVTGVYQVRGRLLVATVVTSSGTDFTATELGNLNALAAASASRLRQLDSGFVST